jgi:hypothetical protein
MKAKAKVETNKKYLLNLSLNLNLFKNEYPKPNFDRPH